MPTDDAADTGAAGVPAPLRDALDRLEHATALDAGTRLVAGVAAPFAGGRAGAVLQGRWLGHALHPLLTDFPLGCWLSAGLLDLTGGRAGRRAAQRLVGLGLLFVPVTAAAGLSDWTTTGDRRARRVGVVHAAGNGVVGSLYLLSWRARRRGHHARGVALSMAGGTLAWGTGYLGGHLSLARRVGTGERGLHAGAGTGRGGGAADWHDEVDDVLGSGASDLVVVLDEPVELREQHGRQPVSPIGEYVGPDDD